jgi:anthranilate synthase component II
MFLLIDNYDSFTYNLFHYLGEIGVDVEVRRNDALSVGDALAMQPRAIVISPGPCDPDRAGICLDLIRSAAGRVPLLGVCLGHQSIGQAFGGRVVRAPQPMHGKTSVITHVGTDIFKGLPSPLTGNRYHSLMVAREALPDCLLATAESEDGVVQGLAHRDLPIYGVQFHPESIATQHGHALLRNFLNIVTAGMTAKGTQA